MLYLNYIEMLTRILLSLLLCAQALAPSENVGAVLELTLNGCSFTIKDA